MKKNVILVMFICSFSAVYSQDLIKEIQRLTLANDSLQKEIKSANAQSERLIKLYNDSLSFLITNLNSEIADLKDENSNVEKKLSEANKKVTVLDKNVVKTERDNLQKQVDSFKIVIAILNDKLAEKDKQIAIVEQDGDQKVRNAKEQGRSETLANLIDTYKKSFNELIKSSTIQTVERDLLLINDNATRKKLENLEKYFTAQQVLSEQYNEKKVLTAQKQINGLEQTELVKDLNAKLSKYGMCNKELRNVIQEIIKIDENFNANNEQTEKAKKEDISYVITRYFYDYQSFSFSAYPYLAHIILEICTKKQQNANTDISDLLKKL